jgi:hypothetical protein
MIYDLLNSFRTIRNEHFKIKDSWFSVDGLLMDLFHPMTALRSLYKNNI